MPYAAGFVVVRPGEKESASQILTIVFVDGFKEQSSWVFLSLIQNRSLYKR